MKKRKLWMLLPLSACMLFSCTVKETPKHIDGDETVIVDDDRFNINEGKFVEVNGFIKSIEANSRLTFKETLDIGTIFFTLSSSGRGDDGLFFASNNGNEYSLCLGLGNNLYLLKNDGSKVDILHQEKLDVNKSLNFALSFSGGVIDVYLDDELLFTHVDDSPLIGDKYGFISKGKGASFRLDEIYESGNKYNNSLEYFDTKFGNGFIENVGMTSLSSNTLAVHKGRNFEKGTIEATIKLSTTAGDNGIVFGLSDADLARYWEGNDVAYYFFFVSRTGLAYLGKTANGTWSVLGTKSIDDFSATGTYRLKVQKTDKAILGYVNDKLYVFASDATPLTGDKWGVRCGSPNVTVSYISLSPTLPETEAKNLIVGSGSFEVLAGNILSNESRSIAFLKDKQLTEGTIRTSFSPGSSRAGIIFKGSYASEEFYDSEVGLSYWWLYYQSGHVGLSRFKDGVEKSEPLKYVPAGTNGSKVFDVKIVMKGNEIYVYVDGRCAFYIVDNDPLSGGLYGMKSGGSGMMVGEFSQDTSTETDKTSFLVFGHSYMDFWKTYKEDLQYYPDAINIGIGGSVASQWNQTYSDEIITYGATRAVYDIGINDLTGNVAPATVLNHVDELLTKIKTAIPTFEVALLGVSRCTARSTITGPIHETNVLYQQLSASKPWIHYIEMEYLFCDSSGNPISSLFTDGLHPTREGYRLMATEINKVMKDL